MTRILGVPHPERELEDLRRRVYNLERRLQPEATGRPRKDVANELLLGDAGQDQIHAHTHDGDGYIHFDSPGQSFHGNLYQSTSSGTPGTTRQAEVVMASSTMNTFVSQIRLKSDSEDGTLPPRVLIDAGNGRVDIEAATGGAYIFNRNIPTIRGTTAGVSVGSTKFFFQAGTTVLTPPNVTVTFPSSFPNNAVSVTANFGDSPNVKDFYIKNISATGFEFHTLPAATGGHRIYWIAIGY